MTVQHIPAGDIRVGDIIEFLGTWHRVSHLDDRTAAGLPVARAVDGWGITLEPTAVFKVDR